MKRNSGGLTGGTGDVNPQWFQLTKNAVIATYQDVQTVLPRERLPSGGRSQVMEILKVEFFLGTSTTFNPGASGVTQAFLTTTSFSTTAPTDSQYNGKVIAHCRWDEIELSGVGFGYLPGYYMQDLTDNVGHGILIASDNLYFGTIQTNANYPLTAGGNINCRVLYRWKNVQLSEYIGIVQSQQ